MRSEKYELKLGAPGEPRSVEDLRDMSIQVGGGGLTGTANLEGTIDGTNWETLLAISAATLEDIPINNVSALRLNGDLASATVNIRGFNVRGES